MNLNRRFHTLLSTPGLALSFALSLGLSLTGVAQAQLVEDIYRVVVTVTDRTPAAQADALNRAVAEVLVKTSGSRAVPGLLKLHYSAKDLETAMRQVDRYEYRSQRDGGLELSFEFNPDAVANWLKQAGGAVWSNNRPLLLAWISLNGTMLDSEQSALLARVLQSRAGQRGLPLLLPSLDLDDLRSLPAAGLAQASPEQVLAASQRYAPDAVLSGVVAQSEDGQWEAQWRLYLNSQVYPWAQRGQNLDEVLQAGVDSVSDSLASHFVGQAQAPSEVFELRIEGVNGFADYGRVSRYLADLDSLSAWQITAVESGRLRVRVEARGGSAGFAQAVQLGFVLKADPVTDADGPVYRLLPP